MARYLPAVIASARRDYETTNKTLARIALDHEVSERTINRWRDAEGWARRSERVHELPPALRALQEATALLTERAAAAPRPDAPEAAAPATGVPDAPEASGPSSIERIERLVQQELAAEEATRAGLGRLPRTPADAERCARILSTLTQTLYALARLRGAAAPDRETDHDDMPADIDDFRRALARRIEACLESWEADGGPERVAEAEMADDAQ